MEWCGAAGHGVVSCTLKLSCLRVLVLVDAGVSLHVGEYQQMLELSQDELKELVSGVE